MNSEQQPCDNQDLIEDGGQSMVGPFLGLATTICLLAASWIHEFEQAFRLIASILACVVSIVTIRAALKRTPK